MKNFPLSFLTVLTATLVGCSPRPQQTEVEALKQRIAQLETELAQERAKSATPAGPSASEAPAQEPAAVASAASAPESAEDSSAWTYEDQEDKMSGGTTHFARVESTNTVNFHFPYSGEQNARLTIRKDPKYGKDVVFQIQKGQILCPSYEGCSVLVRFDNGKPETFSAVGPEDNSSDTVFLRGFDRFMQKLRKAKIMRISLNIYQEGNPVFEFDVHGFDQERFAPKK